MDFASTSCSSLCCPCWRGCQHTKLKAEEESLKPHFQLSSCLCWHHSRPQERMLHFVMSKMTWYHLRNPDLCLPLSFQTLRLSSSAMGKTTTGQVVNLLSNNVNRLDQVSCPWGILFHVLFSLGSAYWDARCQGLVSARVLWGCKTKVLFIQLSLLCVQLRCNSLYCFLSESFVFLIINGAVFLPSVVSVLRGPPGAALLDTWCRCCWTVFLLF